MRNSIDTLTSSAAIPETLSELSQELLRPIFDKINNLGKQTTKTIFEVGEAFNDVYAITGSKFFNAVVEKSSNVGPKQAKNLMKLVINLDFVKDRLIEQGVPSTVMIELSRAPDPETVEKVLCRIESGEKLSVSAVRDLVKGTEKTIEKEDPRNSPGLLAFRKFADAKLHSETAVLRHCIEHVCVHTGLAIVMKSDFDRKEFVETIKFEAVTAAQIIGHYGSNLSLSKEEPKTIETEELPDDYFWSDRKSDLIWLTKPLNWPTDDVQKWIATEVLSKLYLAINIPIPQIIRDLIKDKTPKVTLGEVPKLAPSFEDLDTLLSVHENLEVELEEEDISPKM